MALAAAQAESTLRCAWSAALALYPVQALALGPLALEHVAVLAYIPTHREEAVRWFESERAPRKAGEMLAAVFGDVPVHPGERTLRSILDEVSHQNPVVLAALIESVREGVLVFWAGSNPDPLRLRWSGGILMRVTALVLETLVQWKRDLGPRWAHGSRDVVRTIRVWLEFNDVELRTALSKRSREAML